MTLDDHIVEETRRIVRRACAKRVRGADQREEAEQETWVLLMQLARRWDDARGAPWNLTVCKYARYGAANALRFLTNRWHDVGPLEEMPDGSERLILSRVERQWLMRTIRRWMRSMPRQARTVLEMDLLDLGNAEIAARLGIGPMAAHQARQRGWQWLRRQAAQVN